MNKIHNEKFHNSIHNIAQEVPPIWFMRQAGRYHQHYQNLKKKHTFWELCTQPELAAETALGPIEDFDFDVSIMFSDLLFPLDCLGMQLEYSPGPKLAWHLNNDNSSQLNSAPNIDQMLFQKEALIQTRKRLPKEKSLIGFVGSPWTLFIYAVLGTHKGDLSSALNNWPLFQHFCTIITPFIIKNIELQLEGGAETVMVFDTAAGELAPQVYHDNVIPELKKIFSAFPEKSLAYYSKKTTQEHIQPELFNSFKLAGLGFDHNWNLEDCFSQYSGFTQGNFNQEYMLIENNDKFEAEFTKWSNSLQSLAPKDRLGWVCGLGHGCLPTTNEQHVHEFIKRIRNNK